VGERRLRAVVLVMVILLLLMGVRLRVGERRWTPVMMVVVRMNGCWYGVTVEW
jgi:hypothetical protein